jgi:arginyl-tRNA synthetase
LKSGVSNHCKEFEGDITMVIFPLLKLIKSNPVELGNKIGTT